MQNIQHGNVLGAIRYEIMKLVHIISLKRLSASSVFVIIVEQTEQQRDT